MIHYKTCETCKNIIKIHHCDNCNKIANYSKISTTTIGRNTFEMCEDCTTEIAGKILKKMVDRECLDSNS